jgi:flagellar protein FlbD
VIRLTRLNGSSFILNADIIKAIEERPDTTITLITGETFIVKDSVQEVVSRAVEYGRMVRAFRP